ncbi:conserved hypothetical protein [Chromobacterium violaceum ATCC 12472]|uniref:Uncharacterized protein n=1 Tax=Chromobacterium violaceum (strain ATCC 12472 / DSM 30191 / JCM 1249 / CCUG 213 / NBRC 12614 / NCIMB 9131 / NCTC 9757 / MK) TaxID=243365 RepID=Q7NR44_CHRVO|nr:conserved hypothetical protein [Chromobacterium violaceum ATCC 12472]
MRRRPRRRSRRRRGMAGRRQLGDLAVRRRLPADIAGAAAAEAIPRRGPAGPDAQARRAARGAGAQAELAARLPARRRGLPQRRAGQPQPGLLQPGQRRRAAGGRPREIQLGAGQFPLSQQSLLFRQRPDQSAGRHTGRRSGALDPQRRSLAVDFRLRVRHPGPAAAQATRHRAVQAGPAGRRFIGQPGVQPGAQPAPGAFPRRFRPIHARRRLAAVRRSVRPAARGGDGRALAGRRQLHQRRRPGLVRRVPVQRRQRRGDAAGRSRRAARPPLPVGQRAEQSAGTGALLAAGMDAQPGRPQPGLDAVWRAPVAAALVRLRDADPGRGRRRQRIGRCLPQRRHSGTQAVPVLDLCRQACRNDGSRRARRRSGRVTAVRPAPIASRGGVGMKEAEDAHARLPVFPTASTAVSRWDRPVCCLSRRRRMFAQSG